MGMLPHLDEGRQEGIIQAAMHVDGEYGSQPAGALTQPQWRPRPAVYRLCPLLSAAIRQMLQLLPTAAQQACNTMLGMLCTE